MPRPTKKTPATAAAPAKTASSSKKTVKNPLFEKRPRNFRLGGDIQPKRDLTRFVKWPVYVRLQRQRRVLLQRLKFPPSINQFTKTLEKNQATQLFKLLGKYVPETKQAKKQRLLAEAQAKVEGKEVAKKAPSVLKFGLNHITYLVEKKKAKLVVIAHDVDPIELVVWLPALCRKMDVPYCIVKSKSRLGALCHQKKATCLALTSVRKEDQNELDNLCKAFRAQYNDNVELRRQWGGGVMGLKSQHAKEKKEKAIALEAAKKAGL